MPDRLPRRDFLKTSAAAAALSAPAILKAQNANDKLNIGWIGVGTRGYAGLDWLHKAEPQGVAVTAICDTYTGHIARAKDRIQTIYGITPKTYNDYRELLADKSIDAVFIMTPEHLHHDMTIAALRAGKNVYVEKPLAHTIEEGFDIVNEWKKSGKIVQVGTQNRSSSLYKKAKEMVEQGMIGDVHYVRAFWYRNSAPNDPAWRYVIPPEANPQNTDWQKFLGSGAQARLGSAALLPVAALLGLLRRHLDRPAGAPDRHRQFRAEQDRAALLHGVGRHLPLDRQDRRPRRARHAQRHLRISRPLPHQLQLLLRQRALRLRRAVLRQRRHHRSAEPPGPELLSGEILERRRAESRRAPKCI